MRDWNSWPVIEVDCCDVQSESEFWNRYLAATKPELGHLFGRNLHAYWDAVEWGGPGWPGDVHLRFLNCLSLAGFRNGDFLRFFRKYSSEMKHRRVELID